VCVGIFSHEIVSVVSVQGCGLNLFLNSPENCILSLEESWPQSLRSWSWQSVADLGLVHPILVFNLQLIHITITCYSKRTG